MASLFTVISLVSLTAAACGTATTATGAAVTPLPSATAPSAGPASPSPSASGGVVPGGPGPVVPPAADCPGWPANVPSEVLPATFVPASVLRCVTGETDVPGQGEQETATLEQAGTGLAPLTNALRQPSAAKAPGQICPDYMTVTPQIVMVSADGAKLRPQLPTDSCGKVQSQVLTALAGLHWQTLSQHRVSQVPAPANT